MTDSRRKAFFRAAATLLLISLIITVICDITYYVSRELTYSTLISGTESVFQNFTFINLIKTLSEILPVISLTVSIVFYVIIIVMLFSAKEKQAGKFIIISAAVSHAFYLLLNVLNTVTANSAVSYLQSNAWNLIRNASITALMILLGLLLTGAFKGGSKVFAFILLGFFAAGVTVTLFELVRYLPSSIELMKNGVTFYKISVVVNRTNEFMLCFNYAAYALCCLTVALKPRESVKTGPETS